MSDAPSISFSSFTSKGVKSINQDFCDTYYNPNDFTNKGAIFAVADGISSSSVSQEASQICVLSFIEDYLATPIFWSVEKSANRVLRSINSWLHAKTLRSDHRFNMDKGYVSTFSAVIILQNRLHLFHVGDSVLFKINSSGVECLSTSHRLYISNEQSYLARAMGMDSDILIDYVEIPLEKDDYFVLATDGVADYLTDDYLMQRMQTCDIEKMASQIVADALAQGSSDNLTAIAIHIASLPTLEKPQLHQQLLAKPFIEITEQMSTIDTLNIKRTLHQGTRSSLYLVEDCNKQLYTLKTPALALQQNSDYLEQFAAEEWITRKLHSKHLLKAAPIEMKKEYFYTLFEYIDAKTLTQWLHDNPHPNLSTVRTIATQIAMGLTTMHKNEMIHQDLRLENILIDETLSVKIIDFGSTYLLGVDELNSHFDEEMPGTPLFLAPEYFLGELGTKASDIFSVGIIIYQLLSQFESPYGNGVARAKSKKAQKKLFYQSLLHHHPKLPRYVDEAVKKAVAIDPNERYQEMSEFIYDLTHPNSVLMLQLKQPLVQRHPQLFWKTVSFLLSVLLLLSLLR